MKASRLLLLPALGILAVLWILLARPAANGATLAPPPCDPALPSAAERYEAALRAPVPTSGPSVRCGPTLAGVRRRAPVPPEPRFEPQPAAAPRYVPEPVPEPEPLFTRAYTLPEALPGLWVWDVRWHERGSDWDAPRSWMQVSSEQFAEVLVTQVFRGPLRTHALPTFVRESKTRLAVTAGADQHDVLTRLLRDGTWTPRWRGFEHAAAEILDIERAGSAAERAWARDAQSRGGHALELALNMARAEARNRASAGRSDPPTDVAPHHAPVPCRLRVRHLHRAGPLLADCYDGSYRTRFEWFAPAPARSSVGYLDDTQLELLEGALARGRFTTPDPDQWLDLRPGEDAEFHLAGGLRLCLERALGQTSRNVVTLTYSLRACAPGGMTFAPCESCALAFGGTLLLAPGDTLLPDGPEASGSHVLLTLDMP